MFAKFIEYLIEFVSDKLSVSAFVSGIIVLIIFAIVSYLLGLAADIILRKLSYSIQSKNHFINEIIGKNNFINYSILFSLFIYRYVIQIVDKVFRKGMSLSILNNILDVAMIVVTSLILRNMIKSIRDYYASRKDYKGVAMNSLFELVNVFISILAVLLSISVIFDINTGAIIGTLGGLTAVLMFVFKDIILGFVAGIQISNNKTVKIGDWIQLPSCNADGIVTNINLVNTKILNWDQTVTVVPTYMFISSPVINFQNMSKLKIRRMQRSILVDVDSVRILSEEEYNNIKTKFGLSNSLDHTKLANITLFRDYAESLLKRDKRISKKYIYMVRQLQSNNFGIPIEFYCFLNTSEWVDYEHMQSEIIEYFIAIMDDFGLHVFQSPRSIKEVKV